MKDPRDKLDHPMQPIGFSERGTIRFKENKIVTKLLDEGPLDINYLWIQVQEKKLPKEDFVQLMQLIGHSVSGFGDLNIVPKNVMTHIDNIANELCESEGKDLRNIKDEFKGWTNDLIREKIKEEAFPFSVLMFSIIGDFNIGTVFRSANAFGAKELFYYGKKKI